MFPPDSWLSLLNFYLIACSGDLNLTVDQFSDERLAQVYQANPGERYQDMEGGAIQLVLEFQDQNRDTGNQNASPIGENEETPENGLISIPLPHLPSYV